MAEIMRDNTAVNELRLRMQILGNATKERLYREVSHILEVLADIDEEIQEGMSNRVGDGFKFNEARKYANRLRSDVLCDALSDLDGIKQDLTVTVAGLVGEEFVVDAGKSIGGHIGKTTDKNFEQTELDIKFVVPPVK